MTSVWLVDRTFLVEAYGGGLHVSAFGARVLAASAGESLGALRFLGTVRVPSDETDFFLFDAADEDVLRRALANAGVRFDRIVEVDATALLGSRAGPLGEPDDP
jgi:hypothetical protein